MYIWNNLSGATCSPSGKNCVAFITYTNRCIIPKFQEFKSLWRTFRTEQSAAMTTMMLQRTIIRTKNAYTERDSRRIISCQKKNTTTTNGSTLSTKYSQGLRTYTTSEKCEFCATRHARISIFIRNPLVFSDCNRLRTTCKDSKNL